MKFKICLTSNLYFVDTEEEREIFYFLDNLGFKFIKRKKGKYWNGIGVSFYYSLDGNREIECEIFSLEELIKTQSRFKCDVILNAGSIIIDNL